LPRPATSSADRHASLEAVRAAATKACEPKQAAENNLEGKMQMSQEVGCLERAMNRDLDKVLVPLKVSSPARFKALMAQQASYRKLATALAFLSEESMFIDFEHGVRTDGTLRGTPTMACEMGAWTDRIVYAHALERGDVPGLVAEVHARRDGGTKTQKALGTLEKTATRFTLVPPEPMPGADDMGVRVLGVDAWKELFAKASSAQELARELARSTCEDVAGLEAALGGAERCRAATTLYYLGTCDPEPEGH
jgi:hypothetical protein